MVGAAPKRFCSLAAAPCSRCLWSGNCNQRRWSRRWSRKSSAADCRCSAWQEQPAGPPSAGQSYTCFQLTGHITQEFFQILLCFLFTRKHKKKMWHQFDGGKRLTGAVSFSVHDGRTLSCRFRVSKGNKKGSLSESVRWFGISSKQ